MPRAKEVDFVVCDQSKSIEQIMSNNRVSSVEEIKAFYRNGGKGMRSD